MGITSSQVVAVFGIVVFFGVMAILSICVRP
jgi:hypothetical protein